MIVFLQMRLQGKWNFFLSLSYVCIWKSICDFLDLFFKPLWVKYSISMFFSSLDTSLFIYFTSVLASVPVGTE